MKYLQLVWFGIWRKPGRTVLIFLQISVAFALFGVLQGLKTGVEHAVSAARADLLLVHSRSSMAEPMALASLEQIKAVPGVRVAVPVDLSGAEYQKPSQRIGLVAIGPEKDWTSAFTFDISPDALAAFQNLRTGALARAELAKKYGWKIGDRIPLMNGIAQLDGSTDWVFDIVGFFRDSDVGSGTDSILIQYRYFDEARHTGKGNINHVNVALQDPKLAVTVADEIDRRFANSANETRTESLREMAQLNMQAIGDLNFLIRAVVGAVFVALLFAIATMMMQSLRERTPELAVLKTLGFTDHALFLLILCEALIVCMAAALFGLALATLAFPFASKFVPGLSMPPVVVAVGISISIVVGMISAAAPAIRAAKLEVAAALANR